MAQNDAPRYPCQCCRRRQTNMTLSISAILLKNLEVYFRSCNTAGPTAASVVTVGSNRVNIYTGTGAPSVVAHIGSIYLRDDGGTSTTLYVKESGNGASTGWIAK